MSQYPLKIGIDTDKQIRITFTLYLIYKNWFIPIIQSIKICTSVLLKEKELCLIRILGRDMPPVAVLALSSPLTTQLTHTSQAKTGFSPEKARPLTATNRRWTLTQGDGFQSALISQFVSLGLGDLHSE